MRKVYLSFLGLGITEGDKVKGYEPARYTLKGEGPVVTRFVQVAEIKLLGPRRFDEIVIVTTQKAKSFHFLDLQTELASLGAKSVSCAIIEEDMSSEGQWSWFEKILEHIQPQDNLTIDLTHGYRAIPIIFSTAIHFMQRAKGISVEHVFYGAYDKDRKLTPIIDMRDFYLINEWAEGVSRLIDDADARKLALLPAQTQIFQAGELNDRDLLESLDDLTNRIRNVDMHTVGAAAAKTLSLVRGREQQASAVGRILLRLVSEKYAPLADECDPIGRYDGKYFAGQLAFIGLLLEHKLYMQAFTAMREVVGSLGLIENPKANTCSANGKKQRRKAEVFINMYQYDEDKWSFSGDTEKLRHGLMPFYKKLKDCGLDMTIRSFFKHLLDYRNDFDHGWTQPKASREDIAKNGVLFYNHLSTIISELKNRGILQ